MATFIAPPSESAVSVMASNEEVRNISIAAKVDKAGLTFQGSARCLTVLDGLMGNVLDIPNQAVVVSQPGAEIAHRSSPANKLS